TVDESDVAPGEREELETTEEDLEATSEMEVELRSHFARAETIEESEERPELAESRASESGEGEREAVGVSAEQQRVLQREELLRLAREEAARERAAVAGVAGPAGPRGRTSRPPLRLPSRDDAPALELSDGAEEVLAEELVEVGELSPEEEAQAAV